MKNIKELRKETIKKLEELKNNLSYSTEENYCDMINIMIDYDNEAQDKLYLDDMRREILKVVDEELLPYYLESNNDPQRLFYAMMQVEYADDLYKVNAYGNLENIKPEDFELCIDEAINRLKESLESEIL